MVEDGRRVTAPRQTSRAGRCRPDTANSRIALHAHDPPTKYRFAPYSREEGVRPTVMDRGTDMASDDGKSAGQPPKETHRCGHCGAIFKQSRGLKRHLHTVCARTELTASYTCVVCAVVKYRRDEIRRHYRKVHGVIVPPGTELPAEESDLQDYDRDEMAAPVEATRVVKLAGPMPAGDSAPVNRPPAVGAVGGRPPEEIGQEQNPRKRWKASKGPSMGEMEFSAGSPVKDVFHDSGAEDESDWELDLHPNQEL